MTKSYYYFVDAIHADTSDILMDMAIKHITETDAFHALGYQKSRDAATYLVSCAEADATWLATQPWKDSVALIGGRPFDRDIAGDVSILQAFSRAQTKTFDGNSDGTPDTPEQRKAYWFNMI